MALIGREFIDRFQFYVKHWWPARSLLVQAIDQRFKVNDGSRMSWIYDFVSLASRSTHRVRFFCSNFPFLGVITCSTSKENKKNSVIRSNTFSIPMRARPGAFKRCHWTINPSKIVSPYQRNGKVYATKNWVPNPVSRGVSSFMLLVSSVAMRPTKVFSLWHGGLSSWPNKTEDRQGKVNERDCWLLFFLWIPLEENLKQHRKKREKTRDNNSNNKSLSLFSKYTRQREIEKKNTISVYRQDEINRCFHYCSSALFKSNMFID